MTWHTVVLIWFALLLPFGILVGKRLKWARINSSFDVGASSVETATFSDARPRTALKVARNAR